MDMAIGAPNPLALAGKFGVVSGLRRNLREDSGDRGRVQLVQDPGPGSGVEGGG